MEKVNVMWDIERRNICVGFVGIKRFVCFVGVNFEFELYSFIICEGCGEVIIKIEVSNYFFIDLYYGIKIYFLLI